MSSSPTTATGSRSSSPATPESSDNLEPLTFKPDFEFSSLYNYPGQDNHWDNHTSSYLAIGKGNEEPMLHLDDLIQQGAYDESPSLGLSPTLVYPSPPSVSSSDSPTLSHQAQIHPQSVRASDFLVQQQAPVSVTRPVPPPAPRPRKRDPSAASQTVVYPPKESCYNLPIMIPNIPEGGTKSRVETQVRVTVDLAHASSSTGEPFRYDRVGSWKWLKLPPGTATKKRTRKEGKIDPAPHDILHLTANVTCASPPHNPVLSCTSCQAREAKRVARKLAARVRPARSDSDSHDDGSGRSGKLKQEDTTSIVQFNCAEVLDFSTGSAVLPLRITCYCRHHREKVGFNVHFTMMDDAGRVVGTGTTRPIMITDDHKSTNSSNKHTGSLPNSLSPGMDMEWPPVAPLGDFADTRAPSKRKYSGVKDPNAQTRRRVKPYDTGRKSSKGSRENSVTSFPSPSTAPSTLPVTRSPSPTTYGLGSATLSRINEILANGIPPSSQDQEATSVIPSDTVVTVPTSNPPPSVTAAVDVLMPGPPTLNLDQVVPTSPDNFSASVLPPTAPQQPLPPLLPSNMPFSMFFNPDSPPTIPSLPPPKIHRLIPNTGPTIGGIEVTVLGANFHPSVQLNCVFGDTVASSTQRWSDNTLLCLLPPRRTAGVVAVWFDGLEKEPDGSPPSLFTYTDESDRALMELALQVVGLKMTGKIEDAKNVAMRIVGNSGGDDTSNGENTSNMMQLSASSPHAISRDIRRLLLMRSDEHEDFENLIVKFLSILDGPVDGKAATSTSISYPTSSGQTLLHLATFLDFKALVEFLIEHGIDLDARDRNGYTALHFAALVQSKSCAKLLLEAGADMEIVNSLGKTPEEQAPSGFFRNLYVHQENYIEESFEVAEEDDEESRWGDAEGDDEDEIIATFKRSARRGLRRRGNTLPTETSEADGLHPLDQGVLENPVAPIPPKLECETSSLDHDVVDEKHAASFVEMIQRTLAQLPGTQGIIPNMPQLPLPQLPLPNLPHLPGMPAVPWGALPHIPMVFPIFVPMMPGWPSFLGDKHEEQTDKTAGEQSQTMGAGAIRTAQEWRTMCEKWMVAIAAAATRQQAEDAPPPVYTPRAADGEQAHAQTNLEDPAESSCDALCTHASSERPAVRRINYYDSVHVADREVNAYAYRPTQAQARKHKKHDRMLILFWIPILLISLVWGFFMGLQSAFQALRAALPLKSLVR